MDVFIRGGFHAITRKRSKQEELEFKSLGYLPPDLYAIILEYSYISDRCLNENNYLGREFRINGMLIQNIEITRSHDPDVMSLNLVYRAMRDTNQSLPLIISDIIPKSWTKYKCPIIFILELIISQNQKQTIHDYIRTLYNQSDNELTNADIMFFTISAVTCLEIIVFG